MMKNQLFNFHSPCLHFVILATSFFFIQNSEISAKEKGESKYSLEMTDWKNKNSQLTIESIKLNQNNATHVKLSNGSILCLRPIFYTLIGKDVGDSNDYGMFRKEFASVEEIFTLASHFTNLFFELDFSEGQPCQILLTQKDYNLNESYENSNFNYSYRKIYEKSLKEELWQWSGPYSTIPLNFYDTSINKGPLRANLYEHPLDTEFFMDSYPDTSPFADISHAHVLEADLLQFQDTLESVNDDMLQFKFSQIHARIINPIDLEWKKGDTFQIDYVDEGIYVISSLSKKGINKAYLSDPGFSDLRKYKIYPEMPECSDTSILSIDKEKSQSEPFISTLSLSEAETNELADTTEGEQKITPLAPMASEPTIFSHTSKMSAREIKEPDFDKVVKLCKQQMKNSQWEKYTPLAYAVKLGRYDIVKFFMDGGESVNTANPDVQVRVAVGSQVGDKGKGHLKRIQQGATPLEIAVRQQDVEMVKILLSYNSENRAKPDIQYKRYQQIGTAQPDGNVLWVYTDNKQDPDSLASSSILLDAMKLGKQEIIDLLISAYTNPERLYAEHSTVQAQQQPESMRSWIKQYLFLLNGVYKDIPNDVVLAFMSGMANAIHEHNLLHVKNLLDFGWVPTKKDLEQACTENDFPIFELLIQHGCVGEDGPFFYPAKQNRADFIIRLIESGKTPAHEDLLTAINSGSLDVVQAFIQHGIPFNGVLSNDLQKRQPSIFSYLVSRADFDEVIALCRKQMDRRSEKCSPLAYAVKIGRQDVVQFFIENGDQVTSPILIDAVKLGNQGIIDLLIKACTDQKELHAAYSTIQAMNQPESMCSWIKQNLFLWKGVNEEITDDVVQAFMNGMSNAIRDHNALHVLQLLEYGWIPTKKDLEQACAENDLQIFKSLVQHVDISAEGPFFYPAKYNRTDFITHLLENGKVPNREDLITAANSGSLDVVKAFIQHGVPSKGVLSHELQKKQPAVFEYLYSISDFYEVVELCRQQINNPLTERFPPIAYGVKIGRHDIVKFLIDHGESVNMATPDVPVWVTWEGGYNLNTYKECRGSQKGSTPLEIAVSQHDVEMVKILTSYNLENCANPDIQYRRFGPVTAYGDTYWIDLDRVRYFTTDSSILLDALKLGNQEIIDLVIKAYTDPERLYAEHSSIQAQQQPESMRSWLDQTSFLRTGVRNEVPDDIVNLFLKNRLEDAILDNNLLHAEQFLRYGWIITKKEFEQALLGNNTQIIDLLIHHNRVEENLLITAIKFGYLDAVKGWIQSGMPFDGMLIHAVQQQQKSLVEYFLTLPIDKQEIKDAYAIAYQIHAYEIMKILESKL